MSWYSKVVFPRVVKMPTVEELKENGHEYALAGFPGVIGSLDVTHIRMWGISANLKQISTGKEKFASRALETCVNHRGICLAATRGFYGTVSDKSIVKFDGAMVAIREGLYKNNVSEIYVSVNEKIEVSDAYTINDNGYLRYPTMMEPSKYSETIEEQNWSEMLESLRKDVEKFYGELKQEFAILKYGVRFNCLDNVDDIFQTCCAMHNQRKVTRGFDVAWPTIDFSLLDSDLSQNVLSIQRRFNDVLRQQDHTLAGMGPGEHQVQEDDSDDEECASHELVKNRLIKHFSIALEKGEVYWPSKDGAHKLYLPKSIRIE